MFTVFHSIVFSRQLRLKVSLSHWIQKQLILTLTGIITIKEVAQTIEFRNVQGGKRKATSKIL